MPRAEAIVDEIWEALAETMTCVELLERAVQDCRDGDGARK